MKMTGYWLLGFLSFSTLHGTAGTLSYVPIPARNSDAGSGIDSGNTYTSTVCATRDYAVNGVTLHGLKLSGKMGDADRITVNAASGTLANSSGAKVTAKVDGDLREALSNYVFNQDAGDNSRQEIVLDPASLTAGKSYDLRVYIRNTSNQNRTVNLAFAGDGQAAAETGSFNEDDATSSPGGFSDSNQVYYIDYHFTWDGKTTPGITITQNSADASFCFYALTNQEAGGGAPPAVAETTPGQQQPSAIEQPSTAQGGESVAAATASDVGTGSEDFYNAACFGRHGRWVSVEGQGTCWQPTEVQQDWCPYTHGHWGHSDDCGYTWISDADESDWGWACYHYGRWLRLENAGWCWVPGRVWAPAWVSWRYGDDYVGWAPLPPSARCTVDTGISVWVDNTCNIGPYYYNFCRIRDFGSDNLSRVILPRNENVTIVRNTANVTNIAFNRNSGTFFNNGPDFRRVNSVIAQSGSRPIPSIVVNRRQTAKALSSNGLHSQLHGNVLSLAAPSVIPAGRLTKPAVATTIAHPRIDSGWNAVKDPRLASSLKAQIARQTKGQTPQNAQASLPAGLGNTHRAGAPPPAVGAASARPLLHPGRPIQQQAGRGPGQAATPAPRVGERVLHPGAPIQEQPTGRTSRSTPVPTVGEHKPTPGPQRERKPGSALQPSPSPGKPAQRSPQPAPHIPKTQNETSEQGRRAQPSPPPHVGEQTHRPQSTASPAHHPPPRSSNTPREKQPGPEHARQSKPHNERPAARPSRPNTQPHPPPVQQRVQPAPASHPPSQRQTSNQAHPRGNPQPAPNPHHEDQRKR